MKVGKKKFWGHHSKYADLSATFFEKKTVELRSLFLTI